jgi:hypothetical protein
MKKVFTIFAAIALSASTAFAQQVPNGGFENWTSGNVAPLDWGTFGNLTGPGAQGLTAPWFAVKDTTPGNHVGGLASLKLITDTLPAFAGGTNLSSVACLGVLSLDAMQNFGYSGVPYTKRPDTLYFSYKYAPAIAADTAAMEFYLQKNDTSLLGGYGYAILKQISATGGQFVNVAIPLIQYYSSAEMPDTLQMLFFSSTDSAGTAQGTTFGSTLWIDAIHFEASISTGLEPLIGEVKGVNAYPNPASAQVHIAVQADEVGSQVQLFDMQGRMVYTGVINSANYTIDTHSFEAGDYAIRVNSIDHLTTYKGKIAITK